MDGLEMPLVGAGLNVHGNYRISKQVGAHTVSAVVAGNGRRQWDVEKSARLVQGEVERPRVDPEAPFPAVAFPGVVADGAGRRHRAELPDLGARAGVEGAGVAD